MSEQTPRIVQPGDTFLRRGQVLERTGQSRSTLYARMAAGEFPRPALNTPAAGYSTRYVKVKNHA